MLRILILLYCLLRMGCGRQKGERKGEEQDTRKWVKRGESAKAMRTGLQKFSVARTRITRCHYK